MFGCFYRRSLAKIRSRCLAPIQDLDCCCSKIWFDIFGDSIEMLCRFLFFRSDVYMEDVLIGYFYGRSLGFWGATNCTFCLGRHKIRFRSVKDGVLVFDVRTKEGLLLSAPKNKFMSRFSGQIRVVLKDNSKILLNAPKIAVLSEAGLPSYADFRFDDGKVIRVLLYGRGCCNRENNATRSLYSVIHTDDVGMLYKVHSRISTAMLLSLAMYFRMYQRTRWLM